MFSPQKSCSARNGTAAFYNACLKIVLSLFHFFQDALVSSKLMADGIPCHLTAAVAAGFAATLVASPVDVIKTR